MIEEEPKIVCFKSERGGLGRTTTLANVAYLLAAFGYKVGIIDQEPQQPSKLRRLIAGNTQEASDVLSIGQHRGSLRFLADLPSTDTPVDVTLTEGSLSLKDCSLTVFFHRLDREGLEQAYRALEAYENSRIVLVPSLVPIIGVGDLSIYKHVKTTIADLRERHQNRAVAAVMFDYSLQIIEDLYAGSRQPGHPLIENYAEVAKLIVFNEHMHLPYPPK